LLFSKPIPHIPARFKNREREAALLGKSAHFGRRPPLRLDADEKTRVLTERRARAAAEDAELDEAERRMEEAMRRAGKFGHRAVAREQAGLGAKNARARASASKARGVRRQSSDSDEGRGLFKSTGTKKG
jgi:hypothetical protein